MLLAKNHMTTLKNTTYRPDEIGCRKSGFLARNMLAASQQSLVGQVLLTRPGLVLTQDTEKACQLIASNSSHDDIEHPDTDHIVHSPMMYIAEERVIKGIPCYVMIILNAPKASHLYLRDYLPDASHKNRKLPLFNGGFSSDEGQTTDNAPHAKNPIKLLLSRQSHWLSLIPNVYSADQNENAPFVIVDTPDMVNTIINLETKDPLLAFTGECIIPKNQIMHDLATSDLYLTSDLPASVALSPYAETKYLKAFEHAGFLIKDIFDLPQWAKATQQAYTMKH